MRASGFRAEAQRRESYVCRMASTASAVRYRVAIHRAKGCYFAHVIDLPGCFSRGATEVEAVENARSAIKAYLWMSQVLADDCATVHLEIPA